MTNESQLQEFIHFPWSIHPADLYMPILEETIRSWFDGTAEHPGQVDLILVRDPDGAVVARSTVHTHDALERRLGQPTLFFGATEFADSAALKSLISWAESRAQLLGKTQLLGPVALDAQERCGVITSGFEHTTFLDQPWNPPGVPEAFEGLGFQRWTEGATWHLDLEAVEVTRPSEEELATLGVYVDHIKRTQVHDMAPELAGAVNEAMGRQHYYTPMSERQFATSLEDLSLLLDLEIVGLLRDRHTNEIITHCLCIPDISPAVRRAHGNMRLRHKLGLALRRRRYMRQAILVVQGTRADHAHQGMLRLLSRHVLAQLKTRGYRSLRITFVVDTNPASSRPYSKVGATRLHGTTFYRRPVPWPGPAQ